MADVGQGASLASRISELETRLEAVESRLGRSASPRAGDSLPESPSLDRSRWWRAALRGLAEIGTDLSVLP
ncbi:MAG: hypothetical protein ACKOS8_10120, partial [Gemmataceae bacterium]